MLHFGMRRCDSQDRSLQPRQASRLAKRQQKVENKGKTKAYRGRKLGHRQTFSFRPRPREGTTLVHTDDSPRASDPLELDQEAIADLDLLIGPVDCGRSQRTSRLYQPGIV